MTTVHASPPRAAAAPAGNAATATTSAAGKAGGKSTAAASAGDAFAALLQALAGATDAGPVLPSPVDGEAAVAAAGEGTEAAPADPAPTPPAAAALPVAVPFLPVAVAVPRPAARTAPAAGADDAPTAAPVAAGTSASRGKDAAATHEWTPPAGDGAAPTARHAAVPDVPSALAATVAPAKDGESRAAARWSDSAMAGGLHALGAHAASTVAPDAPTVPVHQAALPSHPLDSAFAGDIAAEVKLMADNGLQRAELHLNPADLGPLRIELSLSAQTADISFAAAHATTREGIEQALPALRELLAGQGLQLGQTGVGSGGTGQEAFGWQAAREQGGRHEARPGGTGGSGVGGPGAVASTILVRRNQGMLDLYA